MQRVARSDPTALGASGQEESWTSQDIDAIWAAIRDERLRSKIDEAEREFEELRVLLALSPRQAEAVQAQMDRWTAWELRYELGELQPDARAPLPLNITVLNREQSEKYLAWSAEKLRQRRLRAAEDECQQLERRIGLRPDQCEAAVAALTRAATEVNVATSARRGLDAAAHERALLARRAELLQPLLTAEQYARLEEMHRGDLSGYEAANDMLAK
jgi:hypothetical protein